MRFGLSLRQATFSPELAVRIASKFDSSFASLWFPTLTSAPSPLDLSALALGATRRAFVATGVVRIQEHEPGELGSRARTLAQASVNRFILGIGSGTLAGSKGVEEVVGYARRLALRPQADFHVPVYFAALGPKMLGAALQHADGALMNLCTPAYVADLVSGCNRREGFVLACLVKMFFAEERSQATRMALEELARYNSFPRYGAMFAKMGWSRVLSGLKLKPDSTAEDLPPEIAAVVACNPSRKEAAAMLREFREAGVDLPVINPNVVGTEDFKLRVVRSLSIV